MRNHNTNGWVQDTVNLSGYQGQALNLTFKVVTDEMYNSNFFVDDVAISTTTGNPVAVQLCPRRGCPLIGRRYRRGVKVG